MRISGLPKLNFFRKILWKISNNFLYAITCPTEETKKALEPDNEPVVNLVNYLLNNIEEIVNRKRQDVKRLTLAEANAQAIAEQETDNRSVSELIQARRDALGLDAVPKEGGKQVDSDGVIRSTSGFVPLKTGIGSSF